MAIEQSVRFDHVGISVPDLEKATEWYCATLELTAAPAFAVTGTDLRGIMLLHEASGFRIELLHRPGARPGLTPSSALEAAGTLGFGHMCLCVADVPAMYDHLIAAGCTTRMVPSPSPRAGATVSFVADPWGNLIEVIDRA
ncbi:VOC family protein [Actinoplanes sp. NPDC026619]|uniref:VOC family protein n=1 Tax=Actinoplanes sp. NPDC026619 TaxID=3155798 RepID=UPI0033EE262F